MSRLLFTSGDTLRCDHVKLTPTGWAIIVCAAEGVIHHAKQPSFCPLI
jgi:hypothetical protein